MPSFIYYQNTTSLVLPDDPFPSCVAPFLGTLASKLRECTQEHHSANLATDLINWAIAMQRPPGTKFGRPFVGCLV